jgi:hypothetical protein
MSSPLARRRTALTLAALVLGILAGCSPAASSASTAAGTPAAGSSVAATSSAVADGSASAAAGPLACDVVTTGMIQQALGTTVAAGVSQTLDLGGSTCEFKDAGILVRVFPNRDASFLTGMKGSFSGAVDLPGVGDAAFYSQANSTFMVLKGTTVVQVQAPNQNDQAKLAALAAAIAANL